MIAVTRSGNFTSPRASRSLVFLAGCLLMSLGLHAALLASLPAGGGDSIKRRQAAASEPVSVVLLRGPAPAPQPDAMQTPPPQPAARPDSSPSPSATPTLPRAASRPPARAPRVSPAPALAPPPTSPIFVTPSSVAPQADELEGLGVAPIPASEPARATRVDATPNRDPKTPPTEPGAPASAAEPVLASTDRPADRNETRAPIARPQGPALLDYRIFYEDYQSGNQVAALVLRLELDGDRYRLSTEARASGLMSWIWRGTLIQTSEGMVDEGGLVPLRYVERRGDRSPREASLPPGEARVRFGDGRAVPAPFGTQDRLSILLQIGLTMVSAPGAPAGTVLQWPLLASSRVEASRWRVEGEEALEIGEKTVVTTRLRKLGEPGQSDASIDVWFAQGGDPWPIRLRFSESGGRTLDQVRLQAK